MNVYLGTSTVRSELLVALGTLEALVVRATTSIEAAEQQARLHALVDGGYPLVLVANSDSTDVLIDHLEPAYLASCDTVEERLLFLNKMSEVAGLSDVLSGLLTVLDEAHKGVRSAINVGSGGAVELPDVKDLGDRVAHGTKIMGKKARRHLKKVISKIRKFHRAAVRSLKGKPKRPGASGPRKPRQQKAPPPGGKTRGTRQKPGAQKQGTPPPGAQNPGAQQTGGPKQGASSGPKNWKSTPGGNKRASADITVKGKMNGKASTFTVKKGTAYRIVKTAIGIKLIVKGMHGTFFVSPGDSGKL